VLLVHCGDDCTHPAPSTTSAASHHIFLSLPVTKGNILLHLERTWKLREVYYPNPED
jgi:hypothetical protein